MPLSGRRPHFCEEGVRADLGNTTIINMAIMAELQELIANSVKNYREGSIVKGRILEVRPREVLVDIGYKSEGVIPASEFEDIEDIAGRRRSRSAALNGSKTTKAWSSSPRRRPPTSRTGKRSSRSSRARASSRARSKPSSKAASPSTSASKRSCPARRSTSFRRRISAVRRQHLRFQDRQDQRRAEERRPQPPRTHRAERAEKRAEISEQQSTSAISVKGTVKNITDFGAFIDLDGMDGLLHITDMTWGRLSHPERNAQGRPGTRGHGPRHQPRERARLPRPQADAEQSVGQDRRALPCRSQSQRQSHRTSCPTARSCEIEEGVEGLIHVSELSWTKRIARPSDVLTLGQEDRSRRARHQQGRAEDLARRPPARAQSMGRDRSALPDRHDRSKARSAT